MTRGARAARTVAAIVALVAFARAGVVARTSQADPRAERAYVRAVDAMRALASPPYATYTSTWRSTGLGFEFSAEDDKIHIDVGVGREFEHERTFSASYRGSDRALQYAGDGQRLLGRGRLLEPTWAGAYDILRYGLRGEPIATTPQARERDTPAPANGDADATPSPAPPADIASVAAISPLYYRVQDAGARPCPDNAPGRALHLTARTDVRKHPLTDVVLDPDTDRFCSMTFVVRESGLAGVTGHYTIEFAPFGDYWLVAHGAIVIDVRVFGIAAKHATLEWTIDDVATPDTLPDDTFAYGASIAPMYGSRANVAKSASPLPSSAHA